jgi:release factor glutamine methyltransferase
MLTLLEILQKTSDFFAAKGVESPRLNAELLVGHVLGLPRMQLYLQFERPMAEPELEKLRPLVKRRGQHEPLQYVLGETEFFHLRLKIDRRALIPRPETEYLCELVTQRLASPPVTVLDLGTGCGAIALGLAAKYPGAAVTGVDASEAALALARENAAQLGLAERVRLLQSDWYSALAPGTRFDLIVANPPYLSAEELATAMPEVREHEPGMALTPGADSAEALLRIIAGSRSFLQEGGMLALETGIEQHARLRESAASAGLVRIESQRDLSERDRYLFAWQAGPDGPR